MTDRQITQSARPWHFMAALFVVDTEYQIKMKHPYFKNKDLVAWLFNHTSEGHILSVEQSDQNYLQGMKAVGQWRWILN